MNKVELIGRLTRNPDIRHTQGNNSTAIARFTLAVDRKYKRDGDQSADFISCVAFGKLAEHADKYYHKGIKIAVIGRLQTGSYEHRDGHTVYTTDVIVEELEFAESKSSSGDSQQQRDNDYQQQTYQQRNNNYQQPAVNSQESQNYFEAQYIDVPVEEDLPF